MFLIGPFFVSSVSDSVWVQLIAFGVGTLVTAIILQYVSEKTIYRINKNRTTKYDI